MSNSLQDQLLGLGMVDKKKASQAKKEIRKKNKVKAKTGVDEDQARKDAIEQQRLEKIKKDQELNARQQAQAEAKALQAQIDQIISLNKVHHDGEIAYKYPYQGKFKTLYVNKKVQDELAEGRLVLVAFNGGAAVIGYAAAEKIKTRDESRILVLNQKQQIDEDDPYKDFQIPDDLMW